MYWDSFLDLAKGAKDLLDNARSMALEECILAKSAKNAMGCWHGVQTTQTLFTTQTLRSTEEEIQW